MIEGSCHCGAVRLTLPEPPEDLGSCNCSLCRRIGGLWGYYRPDEVAVQDPDGRLIGYVQGDATLTSWHCAQCGCTTHWSPRDPALERMGVNLRLFDPAVWEPLPRRFIDGASW
jgi:hypothetical protein